MRVKLEDVCERGSSNIKQSDIIKMSGNYPIYGASGLAGKVNFYHQEQPFHIFILKIIKMKNLTLII